MVGYCFGAQRVGTEKDAAFDFGAEIITASGSEEDIVVGLIDMVFGAGTVPNTVEFGEVGGGFRGSENVVGGQGGFGVREGDRDNCVTL